MHIKSIQKLIDLLRGKKKKISFNITEIQNKQKDIVCKLRNKNKIRVGFFVIFDSVFPGKTIFEAMLSDKIFEPVIVVIPDTSRGEDNKIYQLHKTYTTLSKEYGKEYVRNSLNQENNRFIDFTSDFDVVCFANPYDSMTDKLFTVKYFAQKGILPMYVNYGSMPDYYAREHIINLESLNLCWKVFVDTQENLNDVIKYTDIRGKNAVLSGYCKMDSLNKVQKKSLERKKIIIAPHHTVNMPQFPLSNFLEYSDFFLELPAKYPQIDFVFRPHPLLFVTLSRNELWGKEKVEQYINKISSFSNVEYQNGGDYFETFINSSAIIHDCSSFLMEYLYTGHPACYMLKNKEEISKIFAPIGQKCLANYYKAFNKQEIIKFIEDVVLRDDDPMKAGRYAFAQKEIMVNYPNATDSIIKNIKEELI